MQAYLRATGRAPVARAADEAAAQGFLAADEGAEYDQVIEVVCPLPLVATHTIEVSSPLESIRVGTYDQRSFHT